MQNPFQQIDNRLKAIESLLLEIKFAPTPTVEDKFYTNAQMAKLLGMPARTLNELRKAGIIPFIKAGREIRYCLSDVVAALRVQKELT